MNVRRLLTLLGPYLGLLAVAGLFAILVGPEVLFGSLNVRTVANQTVIVAVAALGMTFVIVSGGIDLSVGSVMALTSVVSALMIDKGWGVSLAMLAGVCTGALCGAINGLLITGLRIAPFIATLGMFSAARGFAKYLADEQKVDAEAGWISDLMVRAPDYPTWLHWIPEMLRFSPGFWILLGLGVLMAVVLRLTVFGVHTFAVGSSEATARLCGVRVPRTKVGIYTLCGACAGLSGVLLLGRLNVGDPNAALGKELEVIAAVVIGGASLAGGQGRISGAVIGALLMALLANGCTLTEVPNYVQEIIVGGIIVAAVALDVLRQRRA